VTGMGDLVCPHCRVRWITPPWLFVKPGLTRCQHCDEPIVVTRAVATEANARQARMMAGVPLGA